MRINKRLDSRQKYVWGENTRKLLEFLCAHSNEEFRVDELSQKVSLSRPTIKKHLCSLESNRDVICDGGRPARYRLRPLYPMDKQFAEAVQRTLAYASRETPPDTLAFPLSETEDSKIRVTIMPKGKEISRQYKLDLKSALSVADAAKRKRSSRLRRVLRHSL